ncbi:MULTISPECIES: DUF3316 domain-containing protein [unclassified Vibrio]|uniref:DUF3316 domain-containing protein n=1 Tax=unclassified Vibrio TaxID=2614977 RepID=UPI0010A5CCE3|nr:MULTISPECIES: DUF3316 domain-containing protein [unclassified Vibrio]WGY44789.1 DUF3316 domain-containing protein [Vibrio sp. ABG19]
MKPLIVLLITLLFSSVALSGLRVGTPQTNLTTASYPTQKQAAQAGDELIEQLETMSPSALQYVLPAESAQNRRDGIEIRQLRRSVKPVSTQAGQIEFQSIVTVHYAYSTGQSAR